MGLQHLGGELERIRLGIDDNRFASSASYYLGEGHPVRRWDQDLISWIDEGDYPVEDRLLAPCRYDHLGRLVARAGLFLKVIDDRLLQLERAGCRCISGEILLDCSKSGLLYIVGSRKIRL